MSNIATFNVDDGFVEGLLRGYRIGFITDAVSLLITCFSWEGRKARALAL